MNSNLEATNGEGRLIAIGDIHGCSIALRTLIDVIQPQPTDTVISLGDCIDWGPDCRGVIELLIELSHRCTLIQILGNHEEMLFNAIEVPVMASAWLNCGGDATRRSYAEFHGREFIPRQHLDFLRQCLEFYETPSYIFLHANYRPNLPLEQTEGSILRWRFLDSDRLTPHFSGKTAIVGHTPQTSGLVLDQGFVICIDTDCSRDGWLTALNVHDRSVVQTNQKGQVRKSML